jgi:hypothetical protein
MPLLTAGPSKFLGGGRSPWYRAGGAPVPVAAYQPKGAADLASSYVNLANPGTYDAAPGVAPTFDAATGWTCNGTTQYLTTGVVPANDQTWSMVVRFSEGTNTGVIAGVSAGGTQRFRIYRHYTANKTGYANGVDIAGTLADVPAGVMAVAGSVGYLNGVVDKTGLTAWGGASVSGITIGTSAGLFFAGKIQAIAIYSSVLTADQVAAVSAAMAAL